MTTGPSACWQRIWAVWGLEPSKPPILAAAVTVQLQGQVVVSEVRRVSP